MTFAHSAGVVLFEKDAVLLGKQFGGGWSSFGGRSQNKESPLETAARECHEELRGAIEKTELEKRLKKASKIVSKTPKGFKFYLYFVPFVGLQSIQSNFYSIDPSHLSRCMQEVDRHLDGVIQNIENLVRFYRASLIRMLGVGSCGNVGIAHD